MSAILPAFWDTPEIRQELNKTSNTKYGTLASSVCEDGRVRGLLQFYGANRTGRWAGRIVQPQNLPRTHIKASMLPFARDLAKQKNKAGLELVFGNTSAALSQLIRTALIAAPGHILVDADFSAIEARLIAWLAGEEWVLDVFRTHGKIYEAAAAQMFGVPIEKIKKGNPEYRARLRHWPLGIRAEPVRSSVWARYAWESRKMICLTS